MMTRYITIIAGFFLFAIGGFMLGGTKAEAQTRFSEQCKNGNAAACAKDGEILYKGDGVEKDYDAARDSFDEACDGGSKGGCHYLGYMMLKGDGGKTKNKKGRNILVENCENGFSESCLVVAIHYERKPADLERARYFHEYACNTGKVDSCYRAGHYYTKSDIGAVDGPRAQGLLEKSCTGGSVGGCYSLALLLKKGELVEQDLTAAGRHFGTVCKAGKKNACAELAKLHAAGTGVVQSDYQARTYFEQACDNGSGSAASCVNSANYYLSGKGGSLNEGKARELYNYGCKANIARACFNYGVMTGKGPSANPADIEIRKAALKKSCDLGFEKACG